MTDKQAETIIESLNSIKKLLILQSLDAGHKQSDIASIINTTQGTLSKMFPGGVPKVKN